MEIKWIGCPHFDSNLKDIAYALETKNQDWFHLGAGDNGSGKSTLSIYGCLKVDPTFNIDRIVFTLPQLKKAIKSLQPGQALLCDEFGDIMYSRDWNRRDSIELAKYLMMVRYRRNFIWMNIPKMEYADVYVRQGRVSSMTYTFTVPRKEFDKGEWRTYPALGRFLTYAKEDIINHFERRYYLAPAYVPHEYFPDLKKIGNEEVKHLIEMYEAKKYHFGDEKTDSITREDDSDGGKRKSKRIKSE